MSKYQIWMEVLLARPKKETVMFPRDATHDTASNPHEIAVSRLLLEDNAEKPHFRLVVEDPMRGLVYDCPCANILDVVCREIDVQAPADAFLTFLWYTYETFCTFLARAPRACFLLRLTPRSLNLRDSRVPFLSHLDTAILPNTRRTLPQLRFICLVFHKQAAVAAAAAHAPEHILCFLLRWWIRNPCNNPDEVFLQGAAAQYIREEVVARAELSEAETERCISHCAQYLRTLSPVFESFKMYLCRVFLSRKYLREMELFSLRYFYFASFALFAKEFPGEVGSFQMSTIRDHFLDLLFFSPSPRDPQKRKNTHASVDFTGFFSRWRHLHLHLVS